MAFDELRLMENMTADQRLLFESRYRQAHRSRTTAFVLTLFLGGLGGHRLYLKEPWLAVLYLLFCWTLIPAMIALVELFLIGKRVDRYNERHAIEIAAGVKALGPART